MKFLPLNIKEDFMLSINNFIELKENLEILLAEQNLSHELISGLHDQVEHTVSKI